MNYLATILFSALSIRWPLAGILSFMLAYTGLAGFFEELGILGIPVGAIRPDTVAMVVSIVVLLRRPAVVKIPDTVIALLWIITFTVPVGVFFMSTTMYEFLANSWRTFFWAPTFLALSRLDEREWGLLKDIIIVLMAINGIISFYIVHTGDYGLYRRLGVFRGFQFDPFAALASSFGSVLEALRLVLPGTFAFGTLALFLCADRILSLQHSALKRLVYFGLLICNLYVVFLALTRIAAIALLFGAAVTIFFTLSRSRTSQKAYLIGVSIGVLVALSTFIVYYTETAKTWENRISGEQDGYNSLYRRIDNNLIYWDILTNSYAFVGHPDFQTADAMVGGYNDVVAPMAMWWYYGLVASLCYCGVMIYFVMSSIKLLRSNIPAPRRFPVFITAGMFLAYLIEMLSGAEPQSFDFAFTFSFITSYTACMIFPQMPPTMNRRLISR